uniref:phosphoribosylaminoimidazolesuccinocarboxamide synthase n=1 Tax=Eucampia antarctica TaxID=49252 RepID=A0A7S2R7F3_9STRA|eukprot:CAMPEP_0197827008 /NCGR_PEP_ID=MMETSP1437-20131217/3892_1 /TAXON_ID=49252 ORGANISM="Eucampia antarctica, Strain CCMP1452" /NCGR_SAMPLE_ID=MMETSP1437 /ASSEMBLY_ACC=CAM_ASM_001096 /LENGTH=481 /DNA_ID=CAMNT_0043427705 /DNA_START=42 /DNA_END=1487 /DNA_ORIENTATION=+
MVAKIVIICEEEFVGDPDRTTNSVTAHSIGFSLKSKFGIADVANRLISAPADRLLTTIRNLEKENVVFVILINGESGQKSSDVSSLKNLLKIESPSPVICLSSCSLSTDECALSIAKLCALSCSKVRSAVSHHLATKRQARLVDDIQTHTKSSFYLDQIEHTFDSKNQITGNNVAFVDTTTCSIPIRLEGKVRDRYDLGHSLALVTTDRQSGFDRQLAKVPFKGQVLNLTSAYWFEKTAHIIPNHLIDVPHPNVSIVKKCTPFPIEFVVRSYMTGSTSTSIWKNYDSGVRNYCGHELPEGMVKNQKLWKLLLTPTTKEEEHDRPISATQIVEEGWMNQIDFDVCAKAALEVFAFGQQLAAERGLILVDTKYEFGKDEEGNILLIDEVHTPDSSRYWLASSYTERISTGLEPENIDKEFLRLWFAKNCNPYEDEVLPEAPKDLVVELSRRYISLYEMITWKDFKFEEGSEGKIASNIMRFIA